jgi:hypothetical protein
MAKSSLFPALETPHHSIPYSSAPVPINPQTSSNISEEMHNPKTKRKMYFSVFPISIFSDDVFFRTNVCLFVCFQEALG